MAVKVMALAEYQEWYCDRDEEVQEFEFDCAPALDEMSLEHLPDDALDIRNNYWSDAVCELSMDLCLIPSWNGAWRFEITDNDAYEEYLRQRKSKENSNLW